MIPPTSPSDKLAPMSVPSITARAASPPAIGKLQDPSKGLCLPKASFASTRPSLLPPVGAPPTKSQSTARVVAPPPLHLLPVQRTVGTTIASQLPNSPTNLIMAQSDRAMFSRQQRDSNKMEGCRSRTSSESAVTTTESVRGRVLSPIPGSPPISPSSGSHHLDSSSSTPATIQRAEGSATGLKKLASLSRESKKGHLGEDSANRLPELKKVGSNLDSTRSTVSTRHATQGGPQLGNGYAMFCEPWKREKVIGQGQFGTVFLARNLRTGERMAVKQVMIKSVEMLEQMIAEVTLNCRASFRNQNVVTCMGWSVTNNSVDPREEETFGMDIQTLDGLDKMKAVNQNFNIFMEYVERGSISSLLEKNGPLPEPATRNYMRQLLLGLRSLHAAGIAHRDIKCQNLLLTSENVLKVADFGSAKKVVNQTVGSTSSIQGSIPWMSPEVIRQEVGKGKDEAAKLTGWKFADVWSVGCTMIEMLTGRPPWNNYSNPAAMMFAIAQSKEPPKLPDESVIHPDGLDFLRKCCNVDPGSRPSVAKLIYHPYMRVENVDVNGLYSPKAGSSQHGGRMSLSSTLSDDDDDDLNKSKNNNFATEDRKTATRKKSNVNATRVESQVT